MFSNRLCRLASRSLAWGLVRVPLTAPCCYILGFIQVSWSPSWKIQSIAPSSAIWLCCGFSVTKTPKYIYLLSLSGTFPSSELPARLAVHNFWEGRYLGIWVERWNESAPPVRLAPPAEELKIWGRIFDLGLGQELRCFRRRDLTWVHSFLGPKVRQLGRVGRLVGRNFFGFLGKRERRHTMLSAREGRMTSFLRGLMALGFHDRVNVGRTFLLLIVSDIDAG